ncbi:MAG: class I SAM-dependent methyltransferase [Syntrophorhabdaceae bacterium]|nr:class I SAM-dependent methyltransferase [Syntrophorhabdales bacterium]MBP9561316.1 class I SAM-dependent methyltransferase [Syntrophorhabdaceae bacterium]
MDRIVKGYSDHRFHKRIGELIKQYSKNKIDIRDEVKKLVDFSHYHRLLDLGCGYGWFLEPLPASFDFIMGIDCNAENESQFLSIAKNKSREAQFKRLFLPTHIDMPSGHFDIIVSAYSLYFFPEALPEIRRLMDPEGVFIVITHSKSMLIEGERFFSFDNLRKVIESFSAENGYNILKKFYSRIDYVDYPNELIFTNKDSQALSQYIDFKRVFIEKDANPEQVKERMLKELKERKLLSFNKDDRIFLARP